MVRSLRELNDFFTMCKGRFTKPVEPEDYDGLLEAIDYLKQVRDRTYEIDDAFEPLNVFQLLQCCLRLKEKKFFKLSQNRINIAHSQVADQV